MWCIVIYINPYRYIVGGNCVRAELFQFLLCLLTHARVFVFVFPPAALNIYWIECEIPPVFIARDNSHRLFAVSHSIWFCILQIIIFVGRINRIDIELTFIWTLLPCEKDESSGRCCASVTVIAYFVQQYIYTSETKSTHLSEWALSKFNICVNDDVDDDPVTDRELSSKPK